MTPWHQFPAEAVLRELRTDAATGLTESEASRRLAEYGPNELARAASRSIWAIFWNQLTSLMVIILMVAAVISTLLGDYSDAIAIAAIVLLNAVLGFSQEYRAETAIAALQRLAIPVARVWREGQLREIASTGLVPGDIVSLEAGNVIPADCRILESAALEAQEAALTGESQPVHKTVPPLDAADLPLGDRRNMAYMGTFVVAGRGRGVVVATAAQTELGHIAQLIQGVRRDPTPLQRRLHQMGKRLATVALFLVIVIFVLGLLRGDDLKILLLTAVSIGVAAVPEGLPAIVTIALTLGTQRMLRRKALIRKLPAVETLGSVTVICSDKTGTLTENRMTATVLQTAVLRLDLPALETVEQRIHQKQFDDTGVELLLVAGALCNDAHLQPVENPAVAQAAIGDPTELALLQAAADFGLVQQHLQNALPRIAEVPFSSERRRMTTVHALAPDAAGIPSVVSAALRHNGAAALAFCKGSVESLLDLCTTIWAGGKQETFDNQWRAKLLRAHDALAADGMRILGVAYRALNSGWTPDRLDHVECDLTFVGMFGLIDPARPEAASAVATCQTAGIRVVMITGDHALTAQSIARQLAIGSPASAALLGTQIDSLSPDELVQRAETADVYARVSPAHKLKIIEALERCGHIVAMTGDGVNDAPALKKAAIGIAMGRGGTDVAKEAADMVLLDDNFATIVAAVEEGRVIYDNIRKFIKYILATNSGEIWIMLAAPFLGMPLPLLPLQILWMNLVTDGLPALALGVEPAEDDAMRRPPHAPNESIFARGLGRHVLWVGLLMAAVSLSMGFWYWSAGREQWQTMLFTTLTLSQMAHILAIRTERISLFRAGLFSNTALLGAVLLTFFLQMAIVELPFFQNIFKTVGLSLLDLTISLLLSSIIFWAVETEKWIARASQVTR